MWKDRRDWNECCSLNVVQLRCGRSEGEGEGEGEIKKKGQGSRANKTDGIVEVLLHEGPGGLDLTSFGVTNNQSRLSMAGKKCGVSVCRSFLRVQGSGPITYLRYLHPE